MNADEANRPGPHTRAQSNAFAMVPVSILALELSKPALLLFIAMSGHADGATRRCYASQRTLAAELDWWYGEKDPDRRRLRTYIKELEKAKLIKRAGRHVWADATWTNQWIVAPYLPVGGASSPPGDVLSPSGVEPTGGRWRESDPPDGENRTPLDGDVASPQSDPGSDPSSNPLLREQVRAIGLEPREPRPQSELLEGSFEERRAKARAKLDEEIAKATATADPEPVGDSVTCPVCGAERADVGYRGHGSNCPRFYRAS